MDIPQIRRVQLTLEEAALRKQMEAELSGTSRYSGDAALRLVKSLYARKAIPEVRIRTFTEPFPAGRGKSHKDVFERNGCRGEAIFKHPHFVPYLQYFIDGPALPTTTIDGFREILIEGSGSTGIIMNQLCTFVRAEVRKLKLDARKAREEFWRLAVELGYFHADTIRNCCR